jgi:predicted MFS family arabinose efflux permease
MKGPIANASDPGRTAARLLALVSAIVLVDVMFYSAITPLLPSYVEDLDLTKSQAGILSGGYAAGTMAAAVPRGGWPRAGGCARRC